MQHILLKLIETMYHVNNVSSLELRLACHDYDKLNLTCGPSEACDINGFFCQMYSKLNEILISTRSLYKDHAFYVRITPQLMILN